MNEDVLVVCLQNLEAHDTLQSEIILFWCDLWNIQTFPLGGNSFKCAMFSNFSLKQSQYCGMALLLAGIPYRPSMVPGLKTKIRNSRDRKRHLPRVVWLSEFEPFCPITLKSVWWLQVANSSILQGVILREMKWGIIWVEIMNKSLEIPCMAERIKNTF